jgi:hypothetical protein
MKSLLFLLCLFSVNPKDFGALGDGVSDDTAAIQSAADACKSKLQSIQPTGGSYMGSCPELFFPAGKYRISRSIRLCPYQTVRGEDSILIQADPNSGIFEFNGGYQNRVIGMQFVGGSSQIVFGNANVDSSFLTFRDCAFQSWSGYSVVADGTVDDRHLSATLSFHRCRWDGARAVYTHCDTTQFSDCEAHFRGKNIPQDGAWITNAGFMRPNGIYSYGGTLGLYNVTLVPAAPIVPAEDGSAPKQVNAYWIDNGGSVVAERVRFSGEGAGVSPILHRAPVNTRSPYRGSKIAIHACQVSCGQDADVNAAVVTLRGGFPQCLRITACDGLVSLSIPWIRVYPGYNLSSDVTAIGKSASSLSQYTITIQGNQAFTAQQIPTPLQQFVGK